MSITVIIPYYNEADTILLTIKALVNQKTLPKNILFIDSGSTDNSSKIIDDYIINNKQNKLMKNIYSGKMSPSSSLNVGLEYSSTTYVALMDCGLEISDKWLYDHLRIITKNNIDCVSTCIYTDGQSIFDKAMISQTYGYKNMTPCLPGTLIKSKVFESTGNFIEGIRSGYDTDFIHKLKLHNLKREVIYYNCLKYFATNYSKTSIAAFKKVYSYSLAGWKSKGDTKPFIYILLALLLLISLFSQHYVAFLYYLLSRGFLIPLWKSKSFALIYEPSILLITPYTGLLIDISRTLGYFATMPFISRNK